MVVGGTGFGVGGELAWSCLAASWLGRPPQAQPCRCECPDCRLVIPDEVISRTVLFTCVLLALFAGAIGGFACGACCQRRERRPATVPRRILDGRAAILNGRARGGQ